MMRQLERKDFEVAMHKDVKHMFDHQVWEKIPRTEILEYYRNLQRQGVSVKREQLMLIWSFKRKRHADGSLFKQKAGHVIYYLIYCKK
eukprot:4267758-Ditylum_brightwellii.AAC.1